MDAGLWTPKWPKLAIGLCPLQCKPSYSSLWNTNYNSEKKLIRFIIHQKHEDTCALEKERERDAHCNQVGKN